MFPLLQAVIQLVAALPLFLSILKGEAFDALSASSRAIGIFSVITGELGQLQSTLLSLNLLWLVVSVQLTM